MQKVKRTKNETNAFAHTHSLTHLENTKALMRILGPMSSSQQLQGVQTSSQENTTACSSSLSLEEQNNVVTLGDLNISTEGLSQTVVSQSLHLIISKDFLTYSTWAHCSHAHNVAPTKISIRSFLLTDYSCECEDP